MPTKLPTKLPTKRGRSGAMPRRVHSCACESSYIAGCERGGAHLDTTTTRPAEVSCRRYLFCIGFRESGFQTVVARASRPCVGCTIRTGGTPVPLPLLRSSPHSFLAGRGRKSLVAV